MAAALLVWAGLAGAQESLSDLLAKPGANLSDPSSRGLIVERLRRGAEMRQQNARARAAAFGLPWRVVRPDGAVRELADFTGDTPLYFTTHNANAAISTGANLVRSAYAIDGAGIKIGLWDGGSARSTHQELAGRVTVKDGAASADHATHVAGTLIASGVEAAAKGMAPAAGIDSYDWNSDVSEMTARGATAPGQSGAIYLSNHSYGYIAGWDYVGSASRMWEWYGNGTGAAGIEEDFGKYNTYARDQDALAYAASYLLIFRSAGNDRNDDPAAGEKVALSPGNPITVTYSPELHPAGDGLYRGGFDTVSFEALAKNVVTVGSVADAVTSGTRDSSKANSSTFSAWGPADDGRIKPDLVANGEQLFSSINTSNTGYSNYSGTSMSTPNAAGSAALLARLFGNLFPGQAMRASTLKALLLHTADDRGNAGPDYKFGWGLLNAKAAADLIADHLAYPDKRRMIESQLSAALPSRTFTFVWDGTTPIRATLCWTDPAGTATTVSNLRSPRLVNDLNLKLVAPGGGEFLPYVLPFVGTWSQAAMDAPAVTGTNRTDNVEQVYLPSPPAAGTYQVVVNFSGTLANGTQNFSLLFSGAAAVPPPPSPLVITGITPDSVLPGPVSVDLAGSGFRGDTAVKLVRAGQTDRAASGVALVGETLRCQFDLTGAAAGAWDVVATNPDAETYTLPGAFVVLNALWSEAFDGNPPPAGWVSESLDGENAWVITTATSHSPDRSYFAAAPSSRSSTSLTSPPISIPAGATDLQLKFWHRFGLQSGRDGGRIQFSVDGGPWFGIGDTGSGAAFASNGYNGIIDTSTSDFNGLEAWTGTSDGFVETIINLSDAALYAGHQLRCRWILATNNRTAGTGWYVDSVALIGGAPISNQPPAITAPADSSSTETQTDPDNTVFEVVRGTSITLAVGADDDGGEASLTYDWAVVDGPGSPVYFSPDENNAAKATTANFEGTGDYVVTVNVTDTGGLGASSSVNLRVVQSAHSVGVIPANASVPFGGSRQFAAELLDQFGFPMLAQPPAFLWWINGGGTVDANGLFSATGAGGPFALSASAGGFVGNASVTVTRAPADILLDDLSQTYDSLPKPVTVTTVPSGLTYAVTYDGDAAAPSATGTYAVAATITDPNHQGNATGTLVISPPSFANWQTKHFTALEIAAGLAAPELDPDADRLANLVEYVLGTDPRSASAGPVAALRPDAVDVPRLTLEFNRPVALADVTVVVEFAGDLAAVDWEPSLPITVTPNDPPTSERVIAADPVPAADASRRFGRLRVEFQP